MYVSSLLILVYVFDFAGASMLRFSAANGVSFCQLYGSVSVLTAIAGELYLKFPLKNVNQIAER